MTNNQQTTTQAFMAALQAAESTGDVSALLALHAPDVTLRNLTQQTWEGEADGLGVMEWTASGRLRGGHPVEYRGVSLIELSGGKVAAFRTYYDSAAFVVAPA